MRFDEDNARATTLVRTPPDFVGQRTSYEVSDEFVERAIDEIKALGATPIVGSLTPIDADDVEDEARMHAAETGGDLLADYATSMAAAAHQQNTGNVIAENLRRDDLGPDVEEHDEHDEPSFPDDPKVGDTVDTAGRRYEFREDGWHETEAETPSTEPADASHEKGAGKAHGAAKAAAKPRS